MPKLKTDWVTIGRTGKTVDNRTITEEMVKDAVELYDTNQYKAFVWPEHARWYKMGGVEAIRLQKNTEGGYDVQAILTPNDYWIYANESDQKTCTSMELDKLDKFGGRWYLTGLGATDSPASFGTTELRFSKSSETAIRAMPVEFALEAKPEKKSLFSIVFGGKDTQEDNEVDMKELGEIFKAFRDEMKGLKTELSSLKLSQQSNNDGQKSEVFKGLEDKLSALDNKFTDLEKKLGEIQAVNPEEFKKLQEDYKKLGEEIKATSEKLEKALKEADPNGTQSHRNQGHDDKDKDTDTEDDTGKYNLKDYI